MSTVSALMRTMLVFIITTHSYMYHRDIQLTTLMVDELYAIN